MDRGTESDRTSCWPKWGEVARSFLVEELGHEWFHVSTAAADMRVAVYDQEDKVFPMAYTSTKGTLERGVGADLWRNTLSRIPTLFGRLVYLSNLRSPNTGRYEHHGLALVFLESESDRELRKLHQQFLQEW